jgi:hypothetical protein
MLTQTLPSPRHVRTEPVVRGQIFKSLQSQEVSLWKLIWEQHRLHESRRWSAIEALARVNYADLTPIDKAFVANAGLAELTTKPGADRLTRDADSECRKWLGRNDTLATAMQALGTWSRYWNEEEAHHETVFTQLAIDLEVAPPDAPTIIEFRKVFPDDDMLRTLTLLAISEITAAVTYNEYARRTKDPGFKDLLLQVGADEVQHLRYFSAYAQACVDSGEFARKGAFAVAHMFTRPGGELYGATRDHTEDRSGHMNWWDHVDPGQEGVSLLMGIEKKLAMVCKMLNQVTGIKVNDADEIEETWMRLVEEES